MKKIFAAAMLAAAVSSTVVAQEAQKEAAKEPAKEEHQSEGHCEKKEGSKTKDIEAKDREDCKSKGGRWNKGKAHDDHKD